MEEKNGKGKYLKFALCTLQFTVLLSGCVGFQVGGEIQGGRTALMYGDPKVALVHFQQVATLEPGYITNFTIFQEGIWTYVGRANYTVGNLPEARKALEQARSRSERDYLAKLYLGLVLARQGERERGSREVEAGLKGLMDWLDYVDQYTHQGRYWDPGKRIQRTIQKNLAMISGREFDWLELRQNIEWLGKEIEQEIDLARRDESEDRLRESGNNQP